MQMESTWQLNKKYFSLATFFFFCAGCVARKWVEKLDLGQKKKNEKGTWSRLVIGSFSLCCGHYEGVKYDCENR